MIQCGHFYYAHLSFPFLIGFFSFDRIFFFGCSSFICNEDRQETGEEYRKDRRENWQQAGTRTCVAHTTWQNVSVVTDSTTEPPGNPPAAVYKEIKFLLSRIVFRLSVSHVVLWGNWLSRSGLGNTSFSVCTLQRAAGQACLHFLSKSTLTNTSELVILMKQD